MTSEEIMPGRHYTEQEMRNMVYLAQADMLPYTDPNPLILQDQQESHQRSKRFIGYGRNPEERRRMRNERFRLRNERRRLRQEARRQLVQRQQELMRSFFGQSDQTIQRLNNFNAMHNQRVQNNAGQNIVRNPLPHLVLTIQSVTTPASEKLGTQTAVAVGTQTQTQPQPVTTTVESKPIFEQVALPSGK